jgi:uncharacterized protein
MTPQEKDLITTLLTRLKSAEAQAKDPEAEALIRQAMAEQPDAPYFLAQTVLIQDISLHHAQNRIAGLEKELAEAQQAQKPAPSFLGGLFGRSEPPAAPSAGSVPPSGPWTHAAAPPPPPYGPSPGPGYAQPGSSPMAGGLLGGGMGGGGFLRSAAATAAGVAGGALLFEGIRSLFGHGAGGIIGNQGATPGLGETVINNYYGSDPGAQGGEDYASSGFDPGTSGDDASPGADQDFDPGTDQGPDDGGQDYDSGSDFDSGGDDGGGDVSC